MPNIDELSIQFKGKGVGTVIKNINALAGAVESLSNKSRGIDAGKLSSLAGAINQLKGSIPTKNQITRLENLATAISNLNSATGSGSGISTVATSVSTLSSSLNNIKGSSTKVLNQAAQAMNNVGNSAQQAAQQVGQVGQNAKKVKLKTPKMPKVDATAFSSQFEQANKHLDKSYQSVSNIKKALESIKTVVPTDKMKSLREQTEKTRKKYEELRSTMMQMIQKADFDPSSKAWESKSKQLDALRQKYYDLIQMQKELDKEGAGFKVNPNFGKAYQGIATAVGGAKQAFGGVASAVQSANKYINGFLGKLLKIGSASRRAKKDTVSYTESIKKLGKELTRVTKMLKLMITRMALRKVIEEVGNGFKSLALHSQDFDQKMSNLINSSKTLGYSISGMAGQLLSALYPALMAIIDLATRAVNALNQLFSALRGLSTWNKAKEFTGSWADSIKAANKNAKELKKTVLGFDELNQLQDNKNSGGGGNDITDMFEDVPIDPWFQELSKKIKDLASKLFEPIKKAWDLLGDWVKAKWKYALDEVLKLGKSVAKDFWKVWEQPETEQIFKNLLIIIGEIGRTIGNLASQFRKAWEENDTGLHILEAIRDIVLIITNHLRNMATATADWAATLDFTPLLTSIKDWLESLKPAIDAIMGVLEDFYKEVVLKFTKWVIESGLPALIDVFKRFNDEVDWEGLRSKLAELWKHLEPFMETVGEGLIIFVERITTALKDFVNGDTFAEFLEKLEKWMDSVTPEDVANGIEKLVKSLVAFKVAGLAISALSAVAGIISAIATACSGLASVAGGVATFVSAIGGLGTAILPIVGIASAVATAIYSLVQSYGGLEGTITKIKETVGGIVDAIKQKAESIHLTEKVDKLKEAIKGLGDNLGGLKSFWDTIFFFIQKTGTFIGVTLLPLIKDFIKLATSGINIISSLVKAVGGAFDVIVGIFTGDGEKIKKGASDIWEGVKKFFKAGLDWILALLNGMVDLILAPFKAVKYYLVGDPIVIDMWNEIKRIFDESIGKVIEFVTNLKDKILEIFGVIYEKVSEIIGQIKEKLGEWADKFRETKDNIASHINDVKEKVASKLEETKTKLETFKQNWEQRWSDIKTKVSDAKTNIVNKISELASNAKQKFDDIKTKAGDFASKWGEKLNEAKKKVEDFKTNAGKALTDAKDNFIKIFNSIKDGIKAPINGILTVFENMINALIRGFNSFGDKIGSFKIDMPDWAKDKFGVGDIKISVPKINEVSIPRLKNGGMLEDGMFFTANHNELIGGFNNGKTVVANNNQIISGIEQGVFNAVTSAMATQNGNGQYIANNIYLDGNKVATAISKSQDKQNRRYSPAY